MIAYLEVDGERANLDLEAVAEHSERLIPNPDSDSTIPLVPLYEVRGFDMQVERLTRSNCLKIAFNDAIEELHKSNVDTRIAANKVVCLDSLSLSLLGNIREIYDFKKYSFDANYELKLLQGYIKELPYGCGIPPLIYGFEVREI